MIDLKTAFIGKDFGMKAKVKIVVDTNYIYTMDTNRLSRAIDNMNKIGDVYIPKVALDELVQRDIQSIRDIHNNLNKTGSISEIVQIKNIGKKEINKVREYYINLFDNNIIELSTVKINEMYTRALIKKPPFMKKKGSSDKGFKDSLLWLSVLEDDHSEYDEIIILTNDNGFIDSKNDLQNEFKNKHDIHISFMREFNKLSEVDKKSSDNSETDSENIIESNNQLKIVEDFKQLEIYRDRLDTVLYNITTAREYNAYGDYYEYPRFKISTKIDFLPLEKLLDNLKIVTKQNMMNTYISPHEFLSIFKEVSPFEEAEDIKTEDVVELYSLLVDVYLELNEYSKSIVKAIIDYLFTKTYSFDSNSSSSVGLEGIDNIEDDDLPF